MVVFSMADFTNMLAQAGLGLIAEQMQDRPEEWDYVTANSEYTPVNYLRNFVEYQAEYMAGSINHYLNLSIVLYNDRKPAGIWPLCMRQAGEIWVCGSNEGPICPPLFVKGLAEKTRKSLDDKCIELIEMLCRQTVQTEWLGIESTDSRGISGWHRKIMEKDATMYVSHELYVDLTRSLEDIRKSVRKSYKSLLSMGEKLWQIELIDNSQPEVFNEFRELHCRVAGRVTRSLETWNLQEKAIVEHCAFLVALRDKEGVMVGCGLFYFSNSEGLYAVGAYDRELFHLPLGHVVQMKAIETMQELGLRWYKIGHRPYLGDFLASTEKERSIARFKEGFATHVYLRSHTTCPVPECLS